MVQRGGGRSGCFRQGRGSSALWRGLSRKQSVPLAYKPLLRTLYVPGWLPRPAGGLGREADLPFLGAQLNDYSHHYRHTKLWLINTLRWEVRGRR